MKSRILLPGIFIAMLFAGCGENSPIQWRGFGPPPGTNNARDINQRELDNCRFQMDPATLAGNSPSTSTNNNTTRQSDANAFQGAVDMQARLVGGDDQGAAAAPSGSGNQAAPGSGDQASAAGARNPALERIVDVRVLKRDDIVNSQVTTISTRDATLHTQGVARVTRNEYGNDNALHSVTYDSARVDLYYQLTLASDGWRCLAFNANLINTGRRTAGNNTRSGNGSRIGW